MAETTEKKAPAKKAPAKKATAEAVVEAPVEAGHEHAAHDVRDADAVESWVERVRAEEGRIDVAIHVAGIIQVGPVGSTTLGHFRDAVETMLMGPVHLALAVLPTMWAADRGRNPDHLKVFPSAAAVVVTVVIAVRLARRGAGGRGRGLDGGRRARRRRPGSRHNRSPARDRFRRPGR